MEWISVNDEMPDRELVGTMTRFLLWGTITVGESTGDPFFITAFLESKIPDGYPVTFSEPLKFTATHWCLPLPPT